MIKLLFILTSYSVVSSVLAHPVHSAQDEAAVRAEFFEFRQRSIRSCSTELQRRGHTDSAIARRRQLASKTQEKRGLAGKPVRRRDFAEHNNGHASATDISVGDDEANLFFDNSSCTLQPWVTQGTIVGLFCFLANGMFRPILCRWRAHSFGCDG